MHLYIFGTLGGIIGICSQIPQLIKCWRTKKVRDLSLNTFLLLVANNTLWFLHGVFNQDPTLYIANAVAIIFPLGVVVAILKYKK